MSLCLDFGLWLVVSSVTGVYKDKNSTTGGRSGSWTNKRLLSEKHFTSSAHEHIVQEYPTDFCV